MTMFSSFWMANPGGGGYSVGNSMVLDDGSSQNLKRTPTVNGNGNNFTISFWVKRGIIDSARQWLFVSQVGFTVNYFAAFFVENGGTSNAPEDTLVIRNIEGSSQVYTSRVFRDPHAWYHIVIAVDTSLSESNIIKLWVNGEAETLNQDPGGGGWPTVGDAFKWNQTEPHTIGSSTGGSQGFDGYVSEFVNVDGQTLTPTSFGEYDTSGVWRPIDLTTTITTNATGVIPTSSNWDIGSTLSAGTGTLDFTSGGGTSAASTKLLTGDFTVTFTATALNDALFGVFAADERGTFNSSQDDGFMDSMTNSFWYDEGAAGGTFYFGSTSEATGVAIAAGSVVTITRSGSTISITDDASTVHTFTGTYSSTMYFLGGCRNTGSQSLNFDSISFDKVNQFGVNGFYFPFSDSTNLGADGNYADTAYTSVNFDGSNDYLTRGADLTGLTNGKVGSCSFWFKVEGSNGANLRVMNSASSGGQFLIQRNTDNTIRVRGFNAAGSEILTLPSSSTYTADNKWHHCMASWDLANTTGHLYIDGVDDLGSATTTNDTIDWTNGNWYIGSDDAGSNKWNGDLAELWWTNEYIDLSSSANRDKFFNSTTGEPVNVGSDGSTPTGTAALIYLSGATSTWHTNDGSGGGFTENGALTDGSAVRSVNANDFATSGSPTQSSDTPTNNSATLTTIDGSGATFSNGNLVVGSNTTNSYKGGTGCIGLAPGSGSWYVEALCTGATGSNKEYVFGAATNDTDKSVAGYFPGSATYSNDDEHGYYSGSGGIVYNGSSSTGSVGVYGDGNTVALRFDMDETTPTCKFYVNDTLKHTANLTVGKTYYPQFNTQDLNLTFTVNFGATSFTYTLPTGHLAINTTNLYTNAAPAIEDGTAHFQAIKWSGDNNAPRSLTFSGNSALPPDLMWAKRRNSSKSHVLVDEVRGDDGTAMYSLESDSSGAELDSGTTGTAGYFSSLDANGFTLDVASTFSNLNDSGSTYVGWGWKGDGTSGSSNTDGSIPSTVNVNDTAGFSIVKYTSTNGSGAGTVGHGQTGALDLILVKNLDNAGDNWAVYHSGNTSAPETDYLILNLVNGTADSNTFWNDTAPSSTSPFVFSVGTSGAVNDQGAANNHIAYCFRSIPGYSAFGSYTGNASTNGPVVLLDFKPAYIMIKRIDAAGAWYCWDNAREPYNVQTSYIQLNSSVEEATGVNVDVLSNGLKIKSSVGNNVSGGTYIYAAFAENPFAGSSPATAR